MSKPPQDLLDDLRAEPPRPILRRRVLAAALGRERFPPAARDTLKRMFSLDDAALGVLLDRLNRADAWQPTPMPGLDVMMPGDAALPAGLASKGKLEILARLEPGTPFPHHAHLGEETVLVLEGGFTTSDGAHVRAGETLVMAPKTEHSFVADDGDDCITATLLHDGIRVG